MGTCRHYPVAAMSGQVRPPTNYRALLAVRLAKAISETILDCERAEGRLTSNEVADVVDELAHRMRSVVARVAL